MIDRILINKDIANPGIYRAKLYDDDKVYIPGIMSVKNVDSIEDKSFLPTAVWCAPCEIMTKHETPCTVWVTYEIGDGKKPVILGFQGDSIKPADFCACWGTNGEGSSDDSSGSDSSDGSGGGNVTADASNWLAVVTAVKEAVASQKPGYSQSGYVTITINGKTIKTRTDCSGVVSAMLQAYGAYSPGTMVGTGAMQGDPPPGFKKLTWSGWDNLQAGDILIRGNHTEVYAGSGKSVYNAGSTNSINNPGATTSGYSSYTYVWRPN